MATDTGRRYGFDDLGGDTGFGDYGITGRKRKAYERGLDVDLGDRRRRFGGGYDRDFFGRGPYGDYWPFDYGTTLGTRPFDFGYGLGTYQDVGYPYTFYSGRYGFPQPAQAIGEAGYDLGIAGRRAVDERRYQRLRDWNRVEENPNIDDVTLWRPRADVLDQDSGLRVEFELPGVPREDISLTVKDDVITLAALKPQSRKEEAGFHYQHERHFGKFYRRLALPFMIDPSSVRAYLEMGVLKVHLNRAGGTERISITEERVPIGAPGSTTGAGTRETVSTATTPGEARA